MLARIQTLEHDSESMKAWRRSVEENTKVSLENTEMMKLAMPVIRDVAGAIRTLGWVGSFLKWFALMGVALGSFIAYLKSGVHW